MRTSSMPCAIHLCLSLNRYAWSCQRSLMALPTVVRVFYSNVKYSLSTNPILMTLLTGKALEWAELDLVRRCTGTFLLHSFYSTNAYKQVFEYPTGGRDMAVQIIQLCQDSDSAVKYMVKFRMLAAQSRSNDTALKGLNPNLQAELACQAEDPCITKYIMLAHVLPSFHTSLLKLAHLRESDNTEPLPPPPPIEIEEEHGCLICF